MLNKSYLLLFFVLSCLSSYAQQVFVYTPVTRVLLLQKQEEYPDVGAYFSYINEITTPESIDSVSRIYKQQFPNNLRGVVVSCFAFVNAEGGVDYLFFGFPGTVPMEIRQSLADFFQPRLQTFRGNNPMHKKYEAAWAVRF